MSVTEEKTVSPAHASFIGLLETQPGSAPPRGSAQWVDRWMPICGPVARPIHSTSVVVRRELRVLLTNGLDRSTKGARRLKVGFETTPPASSTSAPASYRRLSIGAHSTRIARPARAVTLLTEQGMAGQQRPLGNRLRTPAGYETPRGKPEPSARAHPPGVLSQVICARAARRGRHRSIALRERAELASICDWPSGPVYSVRCHGVRSVQLVGMIGSVTCDDGRCRSTPCSWRQSNACAGDRLARIRIPVEEWEVAARDLEPNPVPRA